MSVADESVQWSLGRGVAAGQGEHGLAEGSGRVRRETWLGGEAGGGGSASSLEPLAPLGPPPPWACST